MRLDHIIIYLFFIFCIDALVARPYKTILLKDQKSRKDKACLVSTVCLVSTATKLYIMSGDYSSEVTPVPIPNTEVKLTCADGTAGYLWESRSSPDFFYL